MAGHVDDIVDAAHDPDIAIIVPVTGVPGQIVPRIGIELGALVAFVIVPEGSQGARRQGKFDRDTSHLAIRHRVA